MRLTREESRERTRERLIEAARTALARNGYDGTSIGEIAEAAGFTKGAFFSNFDSKEALLLELLRRHKAEKVEQAQQIVQDAVNFDSMVAALHAHLESLDSNRDWAMLDVQLQLQAQRNAVFATQYAEVQRNIRAGLARFIEQVYAHAGRVPQVPPDQLAGIFMALHSGLVLASGADPRRPAIGEMLRFVFDSILAAAPEQHMHAQAHADHMHA